ncbi:hypothetical protein [Kitasatospora sp. NPDC094015]|uniref:hypothetical protein n=1 Tax=Kitasatospora sp. NPDC094015 TaxID=3155205 RepID=UPI00331D2BB0
MGKDFFRIGGVYEHHLAGRRSGGGVLWVQWVGIPPAGFEGPSEQDGVAAGWHRGISPHGLPTRGWYSTTDFEGWVEVPADEREAALAGRPPYDYALVEEYRRSLGHPSPPAPEPCPD